MSIFENDAKQAFLKASGYYEADFSKVFQSPNNFGRDVELLTGYLLGQDVEIYGRMINFFSVPGKYLHAMEIKQFRDSMTDEEWNDFKVEFWSHMVVSGRVAAAVI